MLEQLLLILTSMFIPLILTARGLAYRTPDYPNWQLKSGTCRPPSTKDHLYSYYVCPLDQ